MTVDDGVGMKFIDERRKEAKEKAHRSDSQYAQDRQIPNPSHSSGIASNEIELGSGQASTQQTYPMHFEVPSDDYPADNNHGYVPQQEQEVEEVRRGGEYDYNINDYDQQEIEDGYENNTPLHVPIQILDGPRKCSVEPMEDFSGNSVRPAAVEDQSHILAGLTSRDDVPNRREDYRINTSVIYEP